MPSGGTRAGLTSEALREELVSDVHHAYDTREADPRERA
jgi:hypothetical protein